MDSKTQKFQEYTQKQIQACQWVHKWLLEDHTMREMFHQSYFENPMAAALHGMLLGLDDMIEKLKRRLT